MIDVRDDGHVTDVLHSALSNLGAKIAQDDDTAKFILVAMALRASGIWLSAVDFGADRGVGQTVYLCRCICEIPIKLWLNDLFLFRKNAIFAESYQYRAEIC